MKKIDAKSQFLKDAHPLLFSSEWEGRIVFLDGGFNSLLPNLGQSLGSFRTMQEVFDALRVKKGTYESFRDLLASKDAKPGYTVDTSMKIPLNINGRKRWFLAIGCLSVDRKVVQGQLVDMHETHQVQARFAELRRLTYGTAYLGQRVAMGQESARERDLTILFVDAVESTDKIFAMDLSQSKTYVEDLGNMITTSVESYGGYIDKFLGDGAMVVWGFQTDPRHQTERHPLDAVLAARAMLEKSRAYNRGRSRKTQIQFRVGIESGRVLSGVFRNKHRKVFTSIGPSVNIAARLESHADPDSILISHQHLERLQASFAEEISVLHCSMFRLKGVPEIVKACKIV